MAKEEEKVEEKEGESWWDYAKYALNIGKEVGVAALSKPDKYTVNQGTPASATTSSSGFKIGDTEISTSTILLTVGGTLGLFFVFGMAKKLLK